MEHTVIFTDLDGTLLDAESYSCAAAQPALKQIAVSDIPLIFCSSKTRAEMEALRLRLHNIHPFVSENGGGIYIPKGYFSVLAGSGDSDGYQRILPGLPYADIRERFVRLRTRTGAQVRGFADMSVTEIAALTGLPEDEAGLAQQREFDEAFVFDGDPDESFLQAIEAAGLHWTQGQVFHIMGHHDKGRAVEILLSLYAQQYGDVLSIGMGDSLNDLSMLMAVDQPVLVMHKDGSFDRRISIPQLRKTRLPGAAGWNETMQQLLLKTDANREPPVMGSKDLLDIFHAALLAADPYNAVLQSIGVEQLKLHIAGTTYDLDAFKRIIVVGAGKATARMALAIETLLGNRLEQGLIVVKDGHKENLSIIEQVESSHPVPGEAGVSGTARILEMLRTADAGTLVIGLLSGGASALLVAPVEGLSLCDKQETTRLLLNAGASIAELNAVRKHLSMIKGGRLAQAAYPARLLTLIVSDVIGDPLNVIASGPTAADSSTFADAWAVIRKYELQEKLPQAVVAFLQSGMAGQQLETVRKSDPCMDKTHNVIIASNKQALTAATEKAQKLGFATRVFSETLQGEASEAARLLAQAARADLALLKPNERLCLLCGGETTVTLKGQGKGGRNQEFALAFAMEIEGVNGIALLSAGTDGTDGPTDAAGAMVDGVTVEHSRRVGIEPVVYIDKNDSYAFFQNYDAVRGAHTHIKTGPTGTNVMDIQIVLIGT